MRSKIGSQLVNFKLLPLKQGDNVNTTSETKLAQRSELKLHPTEPGRIECMAVNDEGNDTSAAYLEITDIDVSLFRNLRSNTTFKKILIFLGTIPCLGIRG